MAGERRDYPSRCTAGIHLGEVQNHRLNAPIHTRPAVVQGQKLENYLQQIAYRVKRWKITYKNLPTEVGNSL